jgi:glycosyltransferase involved in cell wall biosynthesis
MWSEPLRRARAAAPALLVFSPLRWGYVHQRPQHLMSRLARHFPVLFVEEPVRCMGAPRLDRIEGGPNIEVLCPRTPLDAAGFDGAQLPAIEALLADFLRRSAIDQPVVWLFTPMAQPLLAGLRPRAVVYDCSDETPHAAEEDGAPSRRERALLDAAALVFASGPALYDARRGQHPNLHCLPNAVEAERFAPAQLDPRSDDAREAARLHAALPAGPRLGFFGVIDERIDLGLVATLAAARPESQIVMVGPVSRIAAAALPQRANLHWLGLQPPARLPYLMHHWDLCLMPYAINAATRFIGPTRTLEYMAGEKPVVSTPLPDVVALHGDVVHIGRGADGFVAACDAALAESPERRSRRIGEMLAIVGHLSWERSAESVRALIEQVLRDAPSGSPRRRGTAARVARVGSAGLMGAPG